MKGITLVAASKFLGSKWVEGEVAIPGVKIVFPWDVTAAIVPFLLFFWGGSFATGACLGSAVWLIRKIPCAFIAIVVPAVVCDTMMGTHPITHPHPASDAGKCPCTFLSASRH